MNYGMQISASGAQTSMYRLEVAANNLANLNTPGFKPDMAAVRQRDTARVEDGLFGMDSNRLLEMLGAGVQAAPNRVKFGQAQLRSTGNPFDLAIRGDGFFQVATGRGNGANDSGVRLTRDGSFTRAGDGRLVTAADGLSVLDTGGNPIIIPDDARVNITEDGVVSTRRGIIARLGIVDVANRDTLTKEGNALFRMDMRRPDGQPFASTGRVSQGHLEDAMVNEISALMSVTSASKSVESNMGMIASHDRMMEMAISRLGRSS